MSSNNVATVATTRPAPSGRSDTMNAVTIAALDVVLAVENQINALRWPPVLDALRFGATLDQVIEVMYGFETTDELAACLLDWALGEEIDGRMTEDEADALMELVHAAGGPAPVPAAAELAEVTR